MHKPHHPDDLDRACDQILALVLRDAMPEDIGVRRALFRFWVESARLEREAQTTKSADHPRR
jgi:hypothetical protein